MLGKGPLSASEMLAFLVDINIQETYLYNHICFSTIHNSQDVESD
jgi:hypothetical protein